MVVVGASVGGIDALVRVMSGLPPGIEAAVLVAQHLGPGEQQTRLPEILGRQSPLEVTLQNSSGEHRHFEFEVPNQSQSRSR